MNGKTTETDETFGQRLRRMRMDAGYPNPSDLARALWGEKKDARGFVVAANRDTIHRYEKDRGLPGRKNLIKLAKALRCKPEDLLPESSALDALSYFNRQLPQGSYQDRFPTSMAIEQAAQQSPVQMEVLADGRTRVSANLVIRDMDEANALFQRLLALQKKMAAEVKVTVNSVEQASGADIELTDDDDVVMHVELKGAKKKD